MCHCLSCLFALRETYVSSGTATRTTWECHVFCSVEKESAVGVPRKKTSPRLGGAGTNPPINVRARAPRGKRAQAKSTPGQNTPRGRHTSRNSASAAIKMSTGTDIAAAIMTTSRVQNRESEIKLPHQASANTSRTEIGAAAVVAKRTDLPSDDGNNNKARGVP